MQKWHSHRSERLDLLPVGEHEGSVEHSEWWMCELEKDKVAEVEYRLRGPYPIVKYKDP